ncbi:uncharacterized protein RHOBADRAFT_53310 [Rhodotorula graminis WP1]|uniref:SANT domain-containing protein n=1 Tax=Rhodotorula graminis (strain WP1) TaxID=578459 RepID=A0A194S3Z6_RHOGW|nr:uncharacterized protein RHOBADRAFT_53310 [Rhodotorula graminis WP1]KPV75317.1 hypothetical protein RHOBADRAFT_53310 [Rhodotorula graminis WP1]
MAPPPAAALAAPVEPSVPPAVPLERADAPMQDVQQAALEREEGELASSPVKAPESPESAPVGVPRLVEPAPAASTVPASTPADTSAPSPSTSISTSASTLLPPPHADTKPLSSLGAPPSPAPAPAAVPSLGAATPASLALARPTPSPAARQRPLPPPPPPPYIPPVPVPTPAVEPSVEPRADVQSAAEHEHEHESAGPARALEAEPERFERSSPRPRVGEVDGRAQPEKRQSSSPSVAPVGKLVDVEASAAQEDVEMAELAPAAARPAVAEQEQEQGDTDMRDAELDKDVDGAHGPPAPAPPSPHPTDELHRHSPTTPQEQDHERERSSSPATRRGDEDDTVGLGAQHADEDPRVAIEQQRLRLTGGVVVPEVGSAERDEVLGATWDALVEPHERLSGALFDDFAARDDRRRDKAIALRRQYKALNDDWKAHCVRLDKLRDRVHRREQHPALGSSSSVATAPQTPSIDSAGMPFYPEPVTPGPSHGGVGGGGGGGLFGGGISSRANRRSAGGAGAAFGGYGDAVRSEAEFLEILASLETADLRDPDARAARTAAVVPDMVIDPSERREVLELAFDDDRYLVDDPVDAYGIDQPLDVWTEDEVETFCKRYAAHPKQFGKIAADLADKSTAQCVLFYYRMKNTIDFRSLSERRGRDGRRKKSKKRPEGGKGSSLLSNLNKKPRMAAPPAPIDERDDEDDGESAPTSPRLNRREPPTSTSAVFTPGPSFARSRPRPSASATASAQEDVSDDGATSRPSTAQTPKSSFLPPASSTPANAAVAAPTPAAHAQLPPSEGMMEAAEALGALGALAAGDDGDESMQTDDLATPKARARKPRSSSAATATDPDAHLGDDSTTPAGPPEPVGAAVGDKAAKPKRRSNTSSYWTVAERNEIVRLLGVHGTDWKKVAEGVGNKTWVQCRNWYQSNAKKQNLVDIVNEGDSVELDGPAAVEHLGHGNLLQERLVTGANGPALPRAGFFDPPDRQQLPPLPSLDNPSSRRSSTGKAGMHIRNMLNDEPEEEGATTPARDDWFGTDGGDAASVSTEDDPDAALAAVTTAQPASSLLSRYDERALDAMRPSSAPQAIETVRAPLNGLPSLFRATQRLPSFPSSLSERRLEAQPRMPAFAGQQPPQWTRSPASPFGAFVASPAPTASPLTPAQAASGDYYRRATFESARTVPGTPDYFTPKPAAPYERYARSVDPAGSTPTVVPYGQQHPSQQQQQQQSASTYPPPHSHPHPHPHSHHHHAHPSPQWSHDPSRR